MASIQNLNVPPSFSFVYCIHHMYIIANEAPICLRVHNMVSISRNFITIDVGDSPITQSSGALVIVKLFHVVI
jgi:hypothetical protein